MTCFYGRLPYEWNINDSFIHSVVSTVFSRIAISLWVQIKISLSSHQDFFSTSIDTSSVPSCWAQNSWNFRSSIDPNFWDQPDLVEWKTLTPTVLHQPAIWHIQPLSHWEQGFFHGSDVKRLDIADDFQIATVLTGRYHWGGARLRRFDPSPGQKLCVGFRFSSPDGGKIHGHQMKSCNNHTDISYSL